MSDDKCEHDAIREAVTVYDGLTAGDIEEIEQISLNRGNFFGNRSAG